MQLDKKNCFYLDLNIQTMDLTYIRAIDKKLYKFKHTSTDHSTLLKVLETISGVSDEHFKIIASIVNE